MNELQTQHLFQEVALRKRSLAQQLFRQQAEENAVIELNNLLATRPAAIIQPSDLTAIEQRHGVALAAFGLNLQEFYAVILNYFVQQHPLTPQAAAVLQHLEALFTLDVGTARELRTRVGQPLYRQLFREAISGGQLAASGRERLQRLAADLYLPAGMTQGIEAQETEAVVSRFAAQVLAREEVSPDDERRLERLCQNLGVRLSLRPADAARLQRYKQYWALKHLPLPVQSVSVQQLQRLDRGTLYLTSKRILFDGDAKNHSIPFGRILTYTAQRHGITLEKDAGKSPFLEFSDRVDVFCIVLQRLQQGG